MTSLIAKVWQSILWGQILAPRLRAAATGTIRTTTTTTTGFGWWCPHFSLVMVSLPEMPGGKTLPGRGLKNGGICSWPRLTAGGRANSNRRAPTVRPWRAAPFLSEAAGIWRQSAMFAELASWENLLLAYRKASRGKRGKANVAAFEHRLEDNLLALQEEAALRQLPSRRLRQLHIHEPKRRMISAAPFRDRVVHHALCNLIEPALRTQLHPRLLCQPQGQRYAPRPGSLPAVCPPVSLRAAV